MHEQVASASLSPDQQAVANTLFEAYRFYHRPGSQNRDLPTNYIEPSPKAPKLDFHQRVSALADYPQVLRKLGLVIDLVVQLELASRAGPRHRQRARRADGQSARVAAPRRVDPLRARREMVRRAAAAEAADISRTGQSEPRGLGAGAGRRRRRGVTGCGLRRHAATHARPATRGPATPDAAAIPALRSAGLALARTGRGEQLLEDLLNRKSKNDWYEGGQPPTFDAEDLVRGYRIDVRDADAPGGAQWFSLHQRVADHEAPPPAAGGEPMKFEIEDEGYVKATAAASERADHPSASDDLYLHEIVFGWEGWSLAVPRPGKRIMEPQKGGDTPLERHDPAAGAPPLVTKLSPASKTLPRLRVGHRYRLRARTVDLAGNSRAFDAKDLEPKETSLATPEVGVPPFRAAAVADGAAAASRHGRRIARTPRDPLRPRDHRGRVREPT